MSQLKANTLDSSHVCLQLVLGLYRDRSSARPMEYVFYCHEPLDPLGEPLARFHDCDNRKHVEVWEPLSVNKFIMFPRSLSLSLWANLIVPLSLVVVVVVVVVGVTVAGEVELDPKRAIES